MKKVYSLLLAGMVGINSGALFGIDQTTQGSCATVTSCCVKNLKKAGLSLNDLLTASAYNVASKSETIAHAAGISLYPILKVLNHFPKIAKWLTQNNAVIKSRSNEHVITAVAGIVTIATLIAVIAHQINQVLAEQNEDDEFDIDEEELEELFDTQKLSEDQD